MNGETLIYSGKPLSNDHSSGVGLLLSDRAKRCLTEWNPISDRLITARFKTKSRPITFVEAYTPTEQASIDDKDAVYDQLRQTLTNVKKSDIVILMGDMNAKVGSRNEGWESIMGTHGIRVMTGNGEMFAELCLQHDLVIGGTIFPTRTYKKKHGYLQIIEPRTK